MSETRQIAINRRARYDYFISDEFEAGIVLVGSEVKALREGKGNLTDAHAAITRGELWLYNMFIGHFDKANQFNHENTRPRKLLVHKEEIRRLIGKTKEKGLTLVPLRMYWKEGKVKVELGLGKGKKNYDKRATESERDAKRETERAVKISV